MSKTPESAGGIELTEHELTSVQGGLTIIFGEDKRVPEGVTFQPKEPPKPRFPKPIPFPGPLPLPFPRPQIES